MSDPVAEAEQADDDAPYGESLNLDFERTASGALGGAPAGWSAGGSGYEVVVDPEVAHSGDRSLRLTSLPEQDRSTGQGEPRGRRFGIATTRTPLSIPARGKRLRLSGYLKTDDVSAGTASGCRSRRRPGPIDASRSTTWRASRVTGGTDSTRCLIVLPVDESAVSVYLGALLPGEGTT